MGGKVLVPTQEHLDRLCAARLQADILGTSTLIVARTDSEAATFITSNIDARDHAFIVGATVPGTPALTAALAQGRDEAAWMAAATLRTFPNAVREAATAKAGGADLAPFEAAVAGRKSLAEMHEAARACLGEEHMPYFDWEAPRAREGYYRCLLYTSPSPRDS